jgi:hypothetical protein
VRRAREVGGRRAPQPLHARRREAGEHLALARVAGEHLELAPALGGGEPPGEHARAGDGQELERDEPPGGAVVQRHLGEPGSGQAGAGEQPARGPRHQRGGVVVGVAAPGERVLLRAVAVPGRAEARRRAVRRR